MMQQLAMWQQMALELATRYEPGTAERMAQTIMGGAAEQPAQEMAANGEITAPNREGTQNASHMVKAREMAASASAV
jgi:hypothetical protein